VHPAQYPSNDILTVTAIIATQRSTSNHPHSLSHLPSLRPAPPLHNEASLNFTMRAVQWVEPLPSHIHFHNCSFNHLILSPAIFLFRLAGPRDHPEKRRHAVTRHLRADRLMSGRSPHPSYALSFTVLLRFSCFLTIPIKIPPLPLPLPPSPLSKPWSPFPHLHSKISTETSTIVNRRRCFSTRLSQLLRRAHPFLTHRTRLFPSLQHKTKQNT
jgi:hypothetical protein